MRDSRSEEQAETTADAVRDRLDVTRNDTVGVILGTGWGDKLNLHDPRIAPLGFFPGFNDLGELPGHARKYVVGYCGSTGVIALSGRIHLNEHPTNPRIPEMVRLQVETMIKLGVRRLIVTCAAGSLPGNNIETGALMVMDGFVTLYAPPMPLFAGEFCSPEDALSVEMQVTALDCQQHYPGPMGTGGHAMLRGPFFEGRRYDKRLLAASGAKTVGMSVLPEACICALYPEVEMLGLAFVTNGDAEVHSHETNLARAKDAGEGLSNYLNHLIMAL